ncbi:MAG: alpha/beta hydrolase [Alphaproteobacteria bacterium]|nr:alpha/beta hydrolase [Alphaproteobacteria bacterium]
MSAVAPKLDPREEHFRVASPLAGRSLFLRYLPPAKRGAAAGRTVLYVHGGTFPSAMSIAHRFDGYSWRDDLCAAGFHVWGLDFLGFGASDPYPEMDEPPEAHPPLGRAAECSVQLENAARFICRRQNVERLSLVAHSWGTIVAGEFAGRCPELVERIVLFGPIARRQPQGARQRLPAWRPVSLTDQWERFVSEVPAGEPAVLSRRHFDDWGERYLDGDPTSRTRSPPAVKVPSAAFQDIFDAWAGEFAYDPARIKVPVAIIRGEWDRMCPDDDARWLFDGMRNAPLRRDIKIARATHLMHLEENRFALYRETEAFLRCGDRPGERPPLP